VESWLVVGVMMADVPVTLMAVKLEITGAVAVVTKVRATCTGASRTVGCSLRFVLSRLKKGFPGPGSFRFSGF
jgi:hypothetical protein